MRRLEERISKKVVRISQGRAVIMKEGGGKVKFGIQTILNEIKGKEKQERCKEIVGA